MITRSLVILGLILVYWCHQSHHHIFLLINTGPLTLASEEFIPLTEPSATSEKEIPIVDSDVGVGEVDVEGSHNVKSESVSKSEGADSKIGHEVPNEIKDSISSTHERNHKSEDISNRVDENKPSKNGGDESPKSENTIPNSNSMAEEESKSKPLTESSSNEGYLNSNENIADVVENDLNKIADKSSDNRKDELENNSASTESSNNETSDDAGNDTASSKVKTPIVTTSVPAVPTPQKDEEPIPSFMEWTQLQAQKLHESNLAQQAVTASAQASAHNGYKSQHATHSQLNKSSMAENQELESKSRKEKESNAKNFASPDCGAKVIQSNPESQNANGVLSSSHDEYMLNKCGIPIWFIVELCEPLKIEKVSLGNLELFSSSPKDIEIGISDRYPTREWTKLGPFTLPDVRAIHSINFPATNASTFGKFLKVNILSHYGTEHFCPLSLVRVNGISEYEVLESENTHPEDMDPAEKEDSALYEEPVIDKHQQSTDGNTADKSVFGSAKDVVINIVKKAAEVLVKSDHKKDKHLSSMADAAANSNCRSLLQCLPDYETPFQERVLSLLACNFSNLLPFLSRNSPWCGWDYCHVLFSRHSIGLPWQPEGFYASLFGGPSVLHALCNYHRPIIKDSCDTPPSTNISETTGAVSGVLGEGYINESLKPVPTIPSSVEEVKDTTKEQEPQQSDNSKGKQEGLSPGTFPESDTNEKVLAKEPERSIPSSEESSTGVPTTTNESQQKLPPVVQTQPGVTEEAAQQQQNGNNQQQQQQPPPPNSQQQQQQKESVFVRLSNRIKTLERNQTLTASYLEELSRRFKKQNEENHHLSEGTKSFMNDSKLKFKLLEDSYKFELRSLRRNTDEIRERLFNVQLQRSLLILLCFLQFVGIVSVCVWVRRKLRYLESQMHNVSEQPLVAPNLVRSLVPVSLSSPSSIGSSHRGSPQHPGILGGRKRINSEASIGSSLNSIEKSKKIRKKKKKLSDLKPGSVKISGPASAPVEFGNGKGDASFKFKYPVSSISSHELPISSNYKENIIPEGLHIEPHVLRHETPVLSTTPPGNGGGAALLSTQVDSPFSMISSTSTNFFVDSTVSTSSRYALLASPGPGATKTSSLKRSGSLTSLDSSSTSSYSYGVKTGSSTVVNGHGDSQSQASSTTGKKRKNKGLKALMPKIFDR